MAASLISLYFWIVFNVSFIPFASTEDENQFIYHNFYVEPRLHRQGEASIRHNGLLQLTSSDHQLLKSNAFYPSPIKFNTSCPRSHSFSTTFVFAIVGGVLNSGGNGMAFVISPSTDFSNALDGPFLGIFNLSNNGLATNHILAIELDTVQSTGFNDRDGNHVGIDVNSIISNVSAPAAFFSDIDGKHKSLSLKGGNPIQIWIEYDGAEKLLNVTLAPITIPRPKRPLLSATLDLSPILLNSMYVGFSAATGALVSDHYILGWSFNKGGQAKSLDISKLPSMPVRSPPAAKSILERRLISIVLILAVVVVLITILAAVYFVKREKYGEINEDWEREYGPQRFLYKNLYKATKGFKDKEVIGNGGFGKVYRGVLSSNEEIAVKKVSHDSKQGMKEFIAEIVSMGRLRHRNLVKLRGYCRRKGEFLLVYDYMPNGSLDKILHRRTKLSLNWFQRFRIIRGVASGLLYLHEDWEQVVLHRDIKPANVLLDNDLNGKLGDFGLARLYDHGSTLQTTKLVGTFGYIAPELLRTGKASTSTDVYSFGVFMLEVACGRRSIEQEGLTEEVNLVDWVTGCWKRGAILVSSDPRLEGLYAEDQMELVLKLGLFCSHRNPAARPSMRQVMQYLDGEVTLPDMPPEGVVIGLFSETNGALESEITVCTTMTLNALLRRERLMFVSYLAVLRDVDEMRIEESQSLARQSWKKRQRRVAAANNLGLVICQEVATLAYTCSVAGSDQLDVTMA
ncbi:Lectin-receptor kinase [Melia azedarach]|uniref:Lectin-receptor kinase n=1 Tax=Melia azedarach TaxID=155640 RepID=A0ACC1WV16_MELAZ|nr:Lectin-receptor kinase [Melia azedarach]